MKVEKLRRLQKSLEEDLTSATHAVSLLDRAIENDVEMIAQEQEQLRVFQKNAKSEELMRRRQNLKARAQQPVS